MYTKKRHINVYPTTRRNPIYGAPFWDLVVHLACATHIKPQVTFICGARPYAPRICIISVAHPITCATYNICGAPHLDTPRIVLGHFLALPSFVCKLTTPGYFNSGFMQKVGRIFRPDFSKSGPDNPATPENG
jgi:hypothetical protein